jgi:hypothetical protein
MARTRKKPNQRKLPPRLAALTRGNVSLTHALQRLLANEAEGSLRPLAALRPAEWLELVYAHGTPDGSTPAAYAASLADSVKTRKTRLRPAKAGLPPPLKLRRTSRRGES